MKTKIATAIALSLFAGSTFAAGPTLYGKINLSLDQISNGDWGQSSKGAGTRGEVNSNSSRIGVKGEEKLTDNMSAVYLMEWQVNVDGNNAAKDSTGATISNSDLTQRNRFLGLKFNKIGTLKVGKYDSYFKTAAGDNQDIYNDHNYLDMTNVLYGEERLNNVVGFETDKNLLGGVQFNIMSAQGESNTTGTPKDQKVRNGFGSGISTSVLYDNKNLGLALGAAANFGIAGKYNGYGDTGTSATNMSSDAYRLTASYDFSNLGFKGFTLGGLWQTAQLSSPLKTDVALNSLKEDAYTITAAYAIPSTKWTVKAEYVNANTTWDTSATTSVDHTLEQYGVGVDYALNKQAKVYAVAAQQKRDWTSATQPNDNRNIYGLGMIYNF